MMNESSGQIDYRPLLEPVSGTDITAYESRIALRGPGMEWVITIIIIVISMSFMAVAATSALVGLIGEEATVLVAAGIFVLIIVLTIVTYQKYKKQLLKRKIAALKFAEKNGFSYVSETGTNGTQPGMIYDEGHSKTFKDLMQLTLAGMPVEWANYEYETGSGKNRKTHWYTYMRITLPRRLPHMVLDSKANNLQVFGVTVSTGLSDTFNNKQTLALEGDFNNYFTLYCPREYERDALYVFAPDLMAVMVDEAKDSDVEIVDNFMYVYTVGSYKADNPDIYKRFMRVAEIVGRKMQSQTDRYIDERAMPVEHTSGISQVIKGEQGIIAPGGTRLKKGINWVTTIIVLFVILWQVLPFILQWWEPSNR